MVFPALALLVLGVFAPVRDLGFLRYDDAHYVTENGHVAAGLTADGVRWAFTNFQSGIWHPLTWLSHMLDVEAFGLRPGPHHLESVALHAASAALVCMLLARLTGALGASALAAALFAVHPLRVESVAWVSERKDVLSVLLGLLAIAAYLRQLRRPGGRGLAVAAVAYALSLLAKPTLVTLPFALLLLDYWPLGRFRAPSGPGPGEAPRRPVAALAPLVIEKLPLFALTLAASLVAYRGQSEAGAMVASDLVPWPARLQNALVSCVGYLRNTFWPTDLAVLYPFPVGGIPPLRVLGAAAPLLLVSAAALRWRRRLPALTVGWLWYLGTLVPVSGLVLYGDQAMADRYSYLPHIGLFLAVVWLGRSLLRSRPRARLAAAGLAAAALATLALLTQAQIAVWRDDIALFGHAVAVTGENPVARMYLGEPLLAAGAFTAAEEQFREVVRLQPDNETAGWNLGIALAGSGQVEEGLAWFSRFEPRRPAEARFLLNLGTVLAEQGLRERAAASFQAALRLRPDYVGAHYNLARVLAESGRPELAALHYREVVRLTPGDAEAQLALGQTLTLSGSLQEGRAHLREALRLDPANPEARAAWERLGEPPPR